MVKGNLFGMTEVFMLETSLKIISMEKEFINGQMEKNMMEIGKIIRWKEKEIFIGEMGEFILEIIITIKNMEMGFLNGLMVENLLGSGTMEHKMDLGDILLGLAFKKKESGKMGKELDGFLMKLIDYIYFLFFLLFIIFFFYFSFLLYILL